MEPKIADKTDIIQLVRIEREKCDVKKTAKARWVRDQEIPQNLFFKYFALL